MKQINDDIDLLFEEHDEDTGITFERYDDEHCSLDARPSVKRRKPWPLTDSGDLVDPNDYYGDN